MTGSIAGLSCPLHHPAGAVLHVSPSQVHPGDIDVLHQSSFTISASWAAKAGPSSHVSIDDLPRCHRLSCPEAQHVSLQLYAVLQLCSAS